MVSHSMLLVVLERMTRSLLQFVLRIVSWFFAGGAVGAREPEDAASSRKSKVEKSPVSPPPTVFIFFTFPFLDRDGRVPRIDDGAVCVPIRFRGP